MVGCKCNICTSKDPHDQRLRTSFILKTASGTSFLIETSPDLRTQLLREKITNIDSVFISHSHADHLHGIDDLRPLCFNNKKNIIPVYSHKKAVKKIQKRFAYIFDKKPSIGGGIPLLKLSHIKASTLKILNESFQFFLLPHGRCKSLGFIHKSFTYIPDCEKITDQALSLIKQSKCQTLLITCLQPLEHDTHLNVDKCFKYIDQIAPQKAYLIHMNHHLSHQKLQEMCNKRFDFPVSPSFDGAKYYY